MVYNKRRNACSRRIFHVLRYVLGLTFVISTWVNAQESDEPVATSFDWFQIEYLLFEHLSSDRHVLRFEDVQYQAPISQDYQYLYTYGEPLSPNQIKPLAVDQSDLMGAYQQLKRSRDNRVISTGMWQQTIDKEASSLPLKITGGNEYQNKRFQLEGSLTIKRSRYVHALVDVYLSDFDALPLSDIKNWFFESEENRWPTTWLVTPLAYPSPSLERLGSSLVERNVRHLKASRRIKDGEVHYLDHPALGMIVTIKKIDNPTALDDGYEDGGV